MRRSADSLGPLNGGPYLVDSHSDRTTPLASDTAADARGPLWVFGPAQDLALLIATPILILPLALLLGGRETAYTVGLLVAGFGALGHHLPGMMRAYGDRDDAGLRGPGAFPVSARGFWSRRWFLRRWRSASR